MRFNPVAWAKLEYFCHRGDTEIGGFGICRTGNLLAIEDFITVKQRVTEISVKFDDDAVADYFEAQVDAGRKPEQFARIWLHTHPGNSPAPSITDEMTFQRVFGGCDWAMMFILARGGQTYCRLRFNTGPGAALLLPTGLDFSQPFTGSDHDAWRAEYKQNINRDTTSVRGCVGALDDLSDPFDDLSPFDNPCDAGFEPPLDAGLFDLDPAESEVCG